MANKAGRVCRNDPSAGTMLGIKASLKSLDEQRYSKTTGLDGTAKKSHWIMLQSTERQLSVFVLLQWSSPGTKCKQHILWKDNLALFGRFEHLQDFNHSRFVQPSSWLTVPNWCTAMHRSLRPKTRETIFIINSLTLWEFSQRSCVGIRDLITISSRRAHRYFERRLSLRVLMFA